MGEMFGRKNEFRGLNAFFPKNGHKKSSHTMLKKTTVSKMNTVSKTPAAVKLTTVSNKQVMPPIMNSTIKSTTKLVFLSLYQLSQGKNKRAITGWLGYKQIAELCNISISTTRRAIRKLTQKGLIERIEVKNGRDIKGSKYKINIAP